jgi:iron complex outermembrane receptor protein
VKGTIKDWEYEVNTGRSTYNVGVSYLAGYANRELLYQAYSNGLINPFGNTDAADFQAFRNLAGIEGKLRDSTFTTSWVGAKANGEPFHVAAGPVGVAMGVERRKETMNDDPGEILRQGLDMAGSGETLPVSGSRTVNAIFGEMAIPLVKGLEAQIAARVDDYSDFGRTTNPKVGLRWQPDKSFMVRASYGEGFRAPTLDELYSQQQTGNASSSFNDPNRCGKAGGDASYDCGADSKLQYNIKSGGNTQLKPETSDQYSIGFVWQPTNWFSADIGIWDVKITNQIQAGIDEALLINDLVNNNGALYGNYVVRYAPSASDIANGLPGKIQYLDERNINYAATKAGGIDYDLLVKLPEFGGAKWALQLVGSHMLKYKTGPQATGPIDVLNKFRINGNTIVKDRFQLSLRTQAGTWGATLSGNYVGSFEDENPNGEGAKVASYLTWDGQVRYSGFKDLTILGGVKSMFNKRPPYTNQESEIWYPGFNPYLHDVRNRMVYVGLTYKFK